jgi:hypothetical protein
VFTPSYLFQHAFRQDILSPLCPNIIMFSPKGMYLAYNSTNIHGLSIIIFPSFRTWFEIAHPLIAGIIWCVCAHFPLTLWVFSFYIALMAMNTWVLMMRFMTPFPPLCEMLTSMCDENNYMHFLHPHLTPLINELTLCSQKWHLHLSQCCQCWPNTSGFMSLILRTSKIHWF